MANTLITERSRRRGDVLSRFLLLFLTGAVGVLALVPTALTGDALAGLPPELAEQPTAVLTLLLLINPLLLLAAGALLGALLAHRVGLRSRLVAWWEEGEPLLSALRADLGPALAWAVPASLLVLALDWLIQPLLDPAWQAAAAGSTRTLATTVAGLLYGGITEEVITRWGLVPLFAWLGMKLLRGDGRPRPAVMWSAITLAGLIFGLLHLPAAAQLAPLTTLVVLRIVGLNLLPALLFGWLFWRRSLEAAMIAHAAFHVVATAVYWLGALLTG